MGQWMKWKAIELLTRWDAPKVTYRSSEPATFDPKPKKVMHDTTHLQPTEQLIRSSTSHI